MLQNLMGMYAKKSDVCGELGHARIEMTVAIQVQHPKDCDVDMCSYRPRQRVLVMVTPCTFCGLLYWIDM
jgi:hypothetical protein